LDWVVVGVLILLLLLLLLTLIRIESLINTWCGSCLVIWILKVSWRMLVADARLVCGLVVVARGWSIRVIAALGFDVVLIGRAPASMMPLHGRRREAGWHDCGCVLCRAERKADDGIFGPYQRNGKWWCNRLENCYQMRPDEWIIMLLSPD
jgi:hypothetical protein